MSSRLALLAAALLLAVPAAARAQDCDYDYDDCDEWYDYTPGSYVGGSFAIARPQGEFADYVDGGLGGDLHYIRKLDHNGNVGLRIDAGILNYGYDHYYADDYSGYETLDVTTTNNIAFIGIGPQIGLPDGRLRPYVNAHVGYSFLWTSTSVEDRDYYDRDEYYDPYASITHIDDWSFSYGAGAGLYVPIRHGDSPVSLDLGVRYHNNGEADYLREGDIVDNQDGSVSLYPVRSDTDLLTFHIGFSVGINR